MPLTFIVNPAAGNGRAGGRLQRLQAAAQAAGLDFAVAVTSRPRHAAELACEAAMAGRAVVAVGGDGTVHEVARGIIESGKQVPLGLVPVGTGNDFSSALGIPRNVEQAVRSLADATPYPIDHGLVRWWEHGSSSATEAPFINAIGAGFDALVADEAAHRKYLPGLAAYLAVVPGVLRRWTAPQARISISRNGDISRASTVKLFLITVGNGVTSGGGFRLTPHARLNDGLLDVCMVQDLSLTRVVQLLPKALLGAHERAPEVWMQQAEKVEIETDAPLALHADGEVVTRTAVRIEVEVVPKGISIFLSRDVSKRARRHLIDGETVRLL